MHKPAHYGAGWRNTNARFLAVELREEDTATKARNNRATKTRKHESTKAELIRKLSTQDRERSQDRPNLHRRVRVMDGGLDLADNNVD